MDIEASKPASSTPIRYDIHSNFSDGLRKTIFFRKLRFGRSTSRSSKVIDFGTNRKRLLVRHSKTLVLFCTVSEIMQVFVHMTPPLFHPNFGVFLLDQISDVGVYVSRYTLSYWAAKLLFQRRGLCDHGTHERHRRMEGRTDGRPDRRHTVA